MTPFMKWTSEGRPELAGTGVAASEDRLVRTLRLPDSGSAARWRTLPPEKHQTCSVSDRLSMPQIPAHQTRRN